MTKFGWCFGPEGSVGDHGSCPYEIGAGGTIVRCSCSCHESAQNALGTRGNDMSAWDNGPTTTDGPARCANTVNRGALPTGLESTNG